MEHDVKELAKEAITLQRKNNELLSHCIIIVMRRYGVNSDQALYQSIMEATSLESKKNRDKAIEHNRTTLADLQNKSAKKPKR